MESKRSPSLLLPVLSGTALWLSFPNFSYFFLAWIGLVPYLFFLTKKPGWKRLVVGHFVMSSIYLGGVLYWIPGVLTKYGNSGWPVAALAMCLMLLTLSAMILPFSVLTRLAVARSSRLALMAAPGFWVLTEVVRNYAPFGGFPWAILGYSQLPARSIVQIADLGGVYLVSFLIVMANAAVLSLLRNRNWRYFLLSALLLGLASVYGLYRGLIWRVPSSPKLTVALAQPDVALAGNGEHYLEKYFRVLPELFHKGVDRGADWVVFPEAQNPYLFAENDQYRVMMKRLTTERSASLLFNSTSADAKSDRYFNSVYLLGPNGDEIYRYDKRHLVPFGEYIPHKEWLEFLRLDPLVKEVSRFSPGDRMTVGTVKGTRFATLICYEGIFPEISRTFVKNGAQILVIVTNDAWYGKTAAPRQHLDMAVFRAIEMRKPLLRCANSGYSAFIDPLGRIRSRSELFKVDMLVSEVSGNSFRSVYFYVGEWLNIVLVAVSGLLAVFGKRERVATDRGRRHR